MVGLPGSGKTHYANETILGNESPFAMLLSSDDIRDAFSLDGTLGTRGYKPYAERFVRGVIENFARGCLHHGRDAIIDATNLTRDHRAEAIYWASDASARTECHYLKCSPETSFKRSAKWIPQADIERLWKNFVEPLPEDGFTKLILVDAEKRRRRR